MNKVKWHRVDGQNTVLMFEEHNGRWLWVSYKTSRVFVPDSQNFSKGYLSFLNAIKKGYEVVYPN